VNIEPPSSTWRCRLGFIIHSYLEAIPVESEREHRLELLVGDLDRDQEDHYRYQSKQNCQRYQIHWQAISPKND
jgi:hypothetical protein